jgi:hypothetical protein
MSLNAGRIREWLEAEDVWPGFNPNRRKWGRVGTNAPLWAQTAVACKMVPKLDKRLMCVGLSDWALLALWRGWMGDRFREAEAGQQLIAQMEMGWVDFKRWLWERFGQ